MTATIRTPTAIGALCWKYAKRTTAKYNSILPVRHQLGLLWDNSRLPRTASIKHTQLQGSQHEKAWNKIGMQMQTSETAAMEGNQQSHGSVVHEGCWRCSTPNSGNICDPENFVPACRTGWLPGERGRRRPMQSNHIGCWQLHYNRISSKALLCEIPFWMDPFGDR